MTTSAPRPPSATRLALTGTAALGAVASAGVVNAEVHVFQLSSPSLTDNTGFYGPPASSFNPFTGEVTVGGPTAPTYIGFASSGDSGSAKPVIFSDESSFSDGDPETPTSYFCYNFAFEGGESKPLVSLLGNSTEIDGGLFSPPLPTDLVGAPVLPGQLSSDWIGEGTVQGFAGFSFVTGVSATPIYGWIELAYDLPSQTLALLSFGYDDSGAAVTTPDALTPYTAPSPIPEPASAAVGAALVAGSVALLQRRRHAALAA